MICRCWSLPLILLRSSPLISPPKEREFLTKDELKAVITHESAALKLAYIRDLFVFASFTVLSFIDIKELTYDRIVEVNSEKWIISKHHTRRAYRSK